MKIVYVHPMYFPSTGGVETVAKEVGERLVKRGHEVKMIVTSAKQLKDVFGVGGKKKKEVINGVEVIRCPLSRIRFKPFIVNIFDKLSIYAQGPWSFGMMKELIKTKADIIHAGPFCGTHNYYAFLISKLKRVPITYFPASHTMDLYHFNRRSLFYLAKKSSKIFVGSQHEKKFYLANGVPESKIQYVPAGISTIYSKSKNGFKKKGKKIITFLGRKDMYKGIDTIFKAVSLLVDKRDDFLFYIAGPSTPPFEEYIKKISKDVMKYVKILDYVDDKVSLLSDTDIFVMPSTCESFGIVYCEAWLTKTPVIGADIGPVAELIDNNKDGLLITPGDYIELANKLNYLLDNPRKVKRMGEKGYKKVIKNFNWDKVTDIYEKTWKEILNENSNN
jgi:glycosyltransferase involved in cell wall biosynthesis